MTKVYAAARALAVLLSIVAAFMAIPNVNVAAVLVLLGVIAGVGLPDDHTMRISVVALVLPVIAVALANIPMAGTHLGAIASNLGLAYAGAAATAIALALFNRVKSDWM